ncbi:MAG: GAF domain-containing sensor histidine kinase, partial [Thermomicrobiales bacterium]
VGALSALLRAQGNLAISLLGTALVAVVFQPLRGRLQRGVNRLIYGERDDPYAVLSRLGRRLEVTLAPDAVLPTIAQTVREALKLPYAAIALTRDDTFVVAAASGALVDAALHLPLIYQHETVGELVIAARSRGEAFNATDRRLLDDLVRQAGIAVHAVRLTTDLQRSRERLVTTREEERRRLRRDLHDGLGPRLGAQMLRIGAARQLLAGDPKGTDALLAALETDVEAALADIRRLVYDLRPPTLDELGLIGAIRESAMQYGLQQATMDGAPDVGAPRVMVEAPEQLPPLSAAVEVAAYRIMQEALTNVVRHADAHWCVICLALDEARGTLRITVTDDGVGIPATHRAGVGLTSMRERATELGGIFAVETPPTGGTRVSAHLPLPPPG